MLKFNFSINYNSFILRKINVSLMFLFLFYCLQPIIAVDSKAGEKSIIVKETKNDDQKIKTTIQQFLNVEELSNVKMNVLKGGMSSSKIFKFEHAGKNYVLRLLSLEDSVEDRQQEVVAQQIVAMENIAPGIHYIDPDFTIMIMDFILDCNLKIAQLNDKENLKKVAQAISKLHHIKGGFADKTMIFDRINKKYLKIIEEGITHPIIVEKVIKKLPDIQTKIEKFSQSTVPSHGDFLSLNICFDGQNVTFIDWTDGRLEDPFFDLAYFAVWHLLNTQAEYDFLEYYFDRVPTSEELDHFYLMKQVVYAKTGTSMLFLSHQLESKQSLQPDLHPSHSISEFIELLAAGKLEYTPQNFYEMGVSAFEECLKEIDRYEALRKKKDQTCNSGIY